MTRDLQYEYRDRSGALTSADKEKWKAIKGSFYSTYQSWYSRALRVVEQLGPDRLEEFRNLYEKKVRAKSGLQESFCIQRWLLGQRAPKFSAERVYDDLSIVSMQFQLQQSIVVSLASRLDSILADIKGVLQADLFDSELSAARELRAKGFLRAAGALAGVVLESHLRGVCNGKRIHIGKKEPTLADFYQALKNADVIDLAQWRLLQRLGDIRNLSAHKKDREPTEAEIEELISATDKLTKTFL
ncbi:MAG: DUF4145 domain-containing protein [Planctomycetes bacterium]|nr:DUF4145 domain-containing protein [Planctomycetota bacterium]